MREVYRRGRRGIVLLPGLLAQIEPEHLVSDAVQRVEAAIAFFHARVGDLFVELSDNVELVPDCIELWREFRLVGFAYVFPEDVFREPVETSDKVLARSIAEIFVNRIEMPGLAGICRDRSAPGRRRQERGSP